MQQKNPSNLLMNVIKGILEQHECFLNQQADYGFYIPLKASHPGYKIWQRMLWLEIHNTIEDISSLHS